MGLVHQKSPVLAAYPSLSDIPHTPALKRLFFKAFLVALGVTLLVLLFMAEQTAGFNESGRAAPRQFTVTTPASNRSQTDLPQNSDGVSSDNSLSTNTSSSQNGGGQTQVTVNGQPVSVPQNGTTTQTVDNGDGTTTTVTASGSHSGGSSSIRVDSTSTSNSQTNSSSSNVNVQTFSSSSP